MNNNKTSTRSSKARIEQLEAENLILRNHNGQLNTMLDAWHKSFGTTQLSHAISRLDVAEKRKVFVNCKLVGADVSANTIELQLPVDKSPKGICVGDSVSVELPS